MKRFFALACVLISACGGGGGGSTPTTPNNPTPPPPANRAPVVNSVNVNPGFGIQDRTVFNFSVSASDPDGDAIEYAWMISGSPFSGQNVAVTFRTGGTATATVTVSDGKGGSANGNQTFVVGSMSGTWIGSGTTLGNFTMILNQVNGQVTGTYSDSLGPGVVGPTGEPGTIDGNGNVVLRSKQAPFTDFTFRGALDSTGRRVTGGIFGSGFTGQSFTMNKQ